jgi:hypothetical protein
MADMIARQNISGPDGGIPEVDDLCPANQREGSSNQPPAEMREKSLHVGLCGHGAIYWGTRSGFYRFAKITREPQVPIGFDRSGPRRK